MKNNKEKLLQRVKMHLDFVRRKIREKLEVIEELKNQSLRGLSKMLPEDQVVFMDLRGNAYRRSRELLQLEGSPYFTKCEIMDESGKSKDYFFAKYEFSEQGIYSWVSPVASIRFEAPGKASYKLVNGETKTVTIEQKEQYMIVDGKVLFFSLEAKDKPRELIYQEHFTKQKSEFVLPEIVAQMEKAQDQVVRASYKGPLSISGPAGSGKTTLALHRVAYLTQVPDTAELYPPDSIIVFVQDYGTKKYFSALLPSLGINNVQIITFAEWAFKILDITDCAYVERYGRDEEEKDLYEYQKLQALKQKSVPAWNKNIFSGLFSHYVSYLSAENIKLFDQQRKNKQLDRFDLTILLQASFGKNKKFEIEREYQTFVKHKLVHKTEKSRVLYSLMIIDEFQNYLPEQLRILKSCLDNKTQSVIYVGDIAQQVKLGTIKEWKNIEETISAERDIRLSKVYRNTKNIISFIRGLGYVVELPVGLKDGPAVVEKTVDNSEEEIKHIKKFIPKYKEGSIGILAKEESYLENFKKEFAGLENIHSLTMLEAQGVEFDIVFLVGIKKEFFSLAERLDTAPEHIAERKRIQKDLLYVALTRAITELHILGPEKISNILNLA